MVLQFDFKLETTIVQPDMVIQKFLSKPTKNTMIEEHVDIVTVADVFLRACAKAIFRNTNKIIADGAVIYDHPEIISDLRKTISLLGNSSFSQSKQITLIAYHDEIKTCIA